MTKRSALLYALCGFCGARTAVTGFVPVTKRLDYESRAVQHPIEISLHRRIIQPFFATKGDVPRDDENKNPNADEIRYSKMKFDKAVRVADAQAKVDRIRNSLEFDLESEMSKVVDTSIEGLTPEERRVEDTVSGIEAELFEAIEREDFDVAISKKEELGKIHVDDCGAVLQVNSAFYKAFSEKDYGLMDSVWLKDKSVLCIHPASPAQVGGRDVMASWRNLFESADGGAMHRSWTEPSDVRLLVRGSTATITCNEDIYLRQFVRGKTRETQLVNKLRATNIFRKVSGKWFLYHHHASWHEDSSFAKKAMGEGSSPSGTASGNKARVIRLGGDPNVAGSNGLLDGTVGKSGLGPLLGGSSADDNSSSPKRIFMGSLSDLLNDGLGGILGDPEGADDGANGKDDDNIGKIIRFKVTSEEDDDGVDDDEDEEEVDDVNEALSMINDWAANKSGFNKPSTSKPSASRNSTSRSNGIAPKDALRQGCIAAIRKLCNQGSITQRHKRLLLSDIISCSAKGEFSQVEVAYELLCGEGDEEDDDAHEEFADQCLVHVRSLMDEQ